MPSGLGLREEASAEVSSGLRRLHDKWEAEMALLACESSPSDQKVGVGLQENSKVG